MAAPRNNTSIVKVQRPIVTNDPDAPWLMYDEKREHMTQVPDRLIPTYVRDAVGKDLKAYFVGAWSSIVGWGLSERVEDQDW